MALTSLANSRAGFSSSTYRKIGSRLGRAGRPGPSRCVLEHPLIPIGSRIQGHFGSRPATQARGLSMQSSSLFLRSGLFHLYDNGVPLQDRIFGKQVAVDGAMPGRLPMPLKNHDCMCRSGGHEHDSISRKKRNVPEKRVRVDKAARSESPAHFPGILIGVSTSGSPVGRSTGLRPAVRKYPST